MTRALFEKTDVLRRFPYSREDFEYKRRKNLWSRAKRFTDISVGSTNFRTRFLSLAANDRISVESRRPQPPPFLFSDTKRNKSARISDRDNRNMMLTLCAVWRFSWISRPFFFRSIIFLSRILYIGNWKNIWLSFSFFCKIWRFFFSFVFLFFLYKILQLHHCIRWFLLMNGYIQGSIQGFIKIGNYLPYKT